MLAMFEPTMLPIASPPLSLSAAPSEPPSSGALVPNATTVSPTTNELTPADLASFDAPRTSSSDPKMSVISPTISHTIGINATVQLPRSQTKA